MNLPVPSKTRGFLSSWTDLHQNGPRCVELLRSSAVDYITFVCVFICLYFALLMGHPRTIFSSPSIFEYLRASLILYPCLLLVYLETSNSTSWRICVHSVRTVILLIWFSAPILSLFSFLTPKYSHQYFILRSCLSAQIFIQYKYRVVVLLCRTFKISGCYYSDLNDRMHVLYLRVFWF
jgi:hypothetical protein